MQRLFEADGEINGGQNQAERNRVIPFHLMQHEGGEQDEDRHRNHFLNDLELRRAETPVAQTVGGNLTGFKERDAHEIRMIVHIGRNAPLNHFKWPCQASVIKTLEAMSDKTVGVDSILAARVPEVIESALHEYSCGALFSQCALKTMSR